jgi:hypothetical protein
MRRILLVTTVATILTGSLCALLKPSHDGPCRAISGIP